jgi:hypothetical protein
MQLLIQLLPLDSFILLEYLLGLLDAVSREPANKMDYTALGICLGPSLFNPRGANAVSTVETVAFSAKVNAVAEYIVEHAAEVTKVPHSLVADVRNYWHNMECSTPTSGHHVTDGSARAEYFETIMAARQKIETDAISTVISFADRTASQQLASKDFTDSEVLKLLDAMPEDTRNNFLKAVHKSGKKLGKPCHNLSINMSTPHAPNATPRPKKLPVTAPHKLFDMMTPVSIIALHEL